MVYSMGDFNLIRVPACKLESLSVDGSPIQNGRLVEIVPPELTNCLVFSDGKDNAIGTVLGSDIHNVRVLTETKGRNAKRQDQMIEITYTDQTSRDEHTAILNVEDKYINDILQAINVIKFSIMVMTSAL
jgi:hypothetical protein